MGKLQGMKHDEIAGVLFISSETVKKHMMAAVRAVKNFFL
jgi:DNA-directed RNA polymerase specialized sigma24 family protein